MTNSTQSNVKHACIRVRPSNVKFPTNVKAPTLCEKNWSHKYVKINDKCKKCGNFFLHMCMVKIFLHLWDFLHLMV